jgi:ABC-2 type transport system ATP-binding protein
MKPRVVVHSKSRLSSPGVRGWSSMDISLKGLAKRFDSDDVLSRIDLDLGGSQIVAVIGLNGAGKTTLLRCLAGAITPTRGTIRWNGSSSIRDDLDLHRKMIFLPDAPLVLEEQTIIQHLVLLLRAYGRDGTIAEQAIVAVLRDLDLIEHCETVLAKLSRGQRYKATLAALLLISPELWLLDEPFASGMDPQGMHTLKMHARKAAATGSCIVYTTQIIEIAEKFCDLLLVVDHGTIADRLGREELRAMPDEGPGSLGDRLAAFRERK